MGRGDEVIAMVVVRPKASLLTVTELGFGKRTPLEDYRVQGRGGSGIINIKVAANNGKVIGAKAVTDQDEMMLISHEGMMVRCAVKDVRSTGRGSQGVRLISIKGKDRVASAACVVPKEKEEEVEPPRPADPGEGALIIESPVPMGAEPVEEKAKRLVPEAKAKPAAPPKAKVKSSPKPKAKPKASGKSKKK